MTSNYLSDPCLSILCPVNSICQSISFNETKCICKEGFNQDNNGSCYENCKQKENIWLHGEARINNKCVNGKIKPFCIVEDRQILHGEVYKMADDTDRICDNGTMKLENLMLVIALFLFNSLTILFKLQIKILKKL